MNRRPAVDVVRTVLDSDSFRSWDEHPEQPDLGEPYARELQRATERSGLDESVITGAGRLDDRRVAVAATDVGFLAGSIGAAAADRLTVAIERATTERLPLLVSPASGGTRMQEGTPAFLQMISISQAIVAHKQAGLPYLVYLRSPTTGGVFASWGSLGHLTVAEPGALLAFLGPRVREILYGSALAEGTQRAENLVEHGVIDAVLPLDGLREMAIRALRIIGDERTAAPLQPAPSAPGAGADIVANRPATTAWESVQITRRPARPGLRALLRTAVEDFVPLRGTNSGESELTVLAGLARLGGISCVLVGQDRAVQSSNPLGPAALRVAQRGFHLAEELRLPVLTVIDTPGADLSIESEEGGMAGEIARCLAALSSTPVPTVSAIMGEGTGGGALALLPADRTVSAEHGWIAPLPPEGASAILHQTPDRAAAVAEQQRIQATDLARIGVVDEIVAEHPAADAEPDAFCARIADACARQLHALVDQPAAVRVPQRHRRYRQLSGTEPGRVGHAPGR